MLNLFIGFVIGAVLGVPAGMAIFRNNINVLNAALATAKSEASAAKQALAILQGGGKPAA